MTKGKHYFQNSYLYSQTFIDFSIKKIQTNWVNVIKISLLLSVLWFYEQKLFVCKEQLFIAFEVIFNLSILRSVHVFKIYVK